MKLATIIIPNQDNNGSDNASIIENTISHMVDINGGVTTWTAKGYWKSDTGTLYADDVTIIQSATTRQTDSFMDELAALVLETTDQEAVYYDFDGNPVIKNRK